MIESDALFAEYIGLDYTVALDLHLYHYAVRDMINWAIENKLKWFRSSSLNYDPKLQMRHVLDPIDLYVRHRSVAMNLVLKRALPFLEPTRHHKILQKFPNCSELWAKPTKLQPTKTPRFVLPIMLSKLYGSVWSGKSP